MENIKRHELDDDALNMVVGGIGASVTYEETTTEPPEESQMQGLCVRMILRMSYYGNCCSYENALQYKVSA